MSLLNTPLTILGFVLAFGALVFLHEFGHYIFARLFKIEVEEFGFGFPPRVAHLFTFSGTAFTLNAIPFGAFVRLKGENDSDVPGGFSTANPFARLAVLLGGPAMNLITGIILFAIVITRVGAPDISRVQIIGVSESSPAQMAGLLADDVITEINGQSVDGIDRLTELVQANLGNEITITIDRNASVYHFKATPRVSPPPNEGSLGITIGNPVSPVSLSKAISLGVSLTLEQGKQLILLPGRLIAGQVAPEQARFVGPVGIYSLYADARERDTEIANGTPESSDQAQPPAVNTLWLLAVISVALGFTNLLPLPALDGGRIIFILPEIVIRRRVPPQYENMIHMIGFALLLILMIYVTTQDIINPVVIP